VIVLKVKVKARSPRDSPWVVNPNSWSTDVSSIYK